MVTAQTQYSLGNARSYFAEHLAVGDYYAEGQTVAGLWFGRGCERLGLAGHVGESEFLRLELKAFTGASRGYLRHPDSPGTVTLPEVLHREQHIIRLARDGIGASHPLVRTGAPLDPRLDTDQREALGQLLGSTHAITVFRGGAGTGKSFVLRQLVDQVVASGRPVVVLAPQRQQVVEMQQAGFPEPATVAQLLIQRELPHGAAVVVDEAGQIGGRQMLDLFRLAQDRDARVILSGDTRQHGPVEASDALVAIERHAGVKPVELRRIRRQNPNLGKNQEEAKAIAQYRSAVEAAANGDLRKSFEQLDAMGAVVPCSAHRPLAVDLAGTVAPPRNVPLRWRRLHAQLVRFGQLAVARLGMIRFFRPKPRTPGVRHEQQRTRKLGV